MNKKIIDTINDDPTKFAKESTIKELETTLRELAKAYYNTGESLVSDEIFDILKDILKKRSPKNKFLKEVGAPISKEKVKLPYPMMSLDKIKPDTSELKKWKAKYKGPYVDSDKLDGVSAQVYKTKDGELKMYIRGDGIMGHDISHLIKYTLPKSLKVASIPNESSIRGELIITKKDFKKIDMANARNTVSGQVNSKHPNMDIVKLIKFISYSVINPRYDQIEQMEKMEKWGFTTVVYKVVKELDAKVLNEYLVKRRTEAEYEVDGIVVVDASKAYDLTKENPKHAFAFKAVLDDQIAETVVEDVIWKVTKDGYLVPRIKISPVKLVGVTITYATAYNAKYILDNKIGPGAVIKLIRSGDVIPKIHEIIKPAKKAKMPDIEYKWNESEVDIIVKDIFGAQKDSTATNMKIMKITNFFDKLGVKYISEGIVRKLAEAGYDSIQKILKANKEDLIEIDGIGEKLVTKIFANLDVALKKEPLAKFMAASNIFGRSLGSKKLAMITAIYPNILDLDYSKKELKEKINEINGFSDKSTDKFVDNLDQFKKFFEEINGIIDISHLKTKVTSTPKKVGTKFKDEIVVFTGFRNKDYEKLVTENDGKLSGSVSGKTTLLVYAEGTENSSKYKKAKTLGVKTMTDKEFKTKYVK
jgi:DNA ligase (NAD+)